MGGKKAKLKIVVTITEDEAKKDGVKVRFDTLPNLGEFNEHTAMKSALGAIVGSLFRLDF